MSLPGGRDFDTAGVSLWVGLAEGLEERIGSILPVAAVPEVRLGLEVSSCLPEVLHELAVDFRVHVGLEVLEEVEVLIPVPSGNALPAGSWDVPSLFLLLRIFLLRLFWNGANVFILEKADVVVTLFFLSERFWSEEGLLELGASPVGGLVGDDATDEVDSRGREATESVEGDDRRLSLRQDLDLLAVVFDLQDSDDHGDDVLLTVGCHVEIPVSCWVARDQILGRVARGGVGATEVSKVDLVAIIEEAVREIFTCFFDIEPRRCVVSHVGEQKDRALCRLSRISARIVKGEFGHVEDVASAGDLLDLILEPLVATSSSVG